MKKAIELKNRYGSMYCSEGNVFFKNEIGGDEILLSGGDEFILYLQVDGETCIISSDDCKYEGVQVCDGGNKIVFSYKFSSLSVSVSYAAQDIAFCKILRVESNNPFYLKRVALENRAFDRELSRGGEGQPVFIGGGMWCGMEFPAAANFFEGSTLCFTQAPFAQTRVFESFPVVYGFDCCGDIFKSFDYYIAGKAAVYKKTEPVRIYCDWGLHDDLAEGKDKVELTAEMTLENIERISALNKKSGKKFDYYIMDAYWFEEDNPYTDFKKRTFPQGVKPVLDALDKAGMKYGLWFDLNCIHAHLSGMEKYDTLLENKSLCFSCDEISRLMTDALKLHIRNHKVKMLKLDFAYFECKNSEHGHSVEHTESKEKSIKNFINMVRELKAAEPELKILCYNGWTTNLKWIGTVEPQIGYAISPYWFEYVDYIYCGDPRPSEIACPAMENSLVYYTDAMIRNFRESNVPFWSIDDHGTMSGSTSTIYWLGKKPFRSGVLMNVMRGGKLNVYGDVSDFTADDIEYYKFVGTVYDDIVFGSYRTDFILGDVRKGEIYGYSAQNAFKGFAVALNPSLEKKNCEITMPSWRGRNVRLKELIRNGETVKDEFKEVYASFGTSLSANGYVLIKWEILPQSKGFDKVALCPGDSIAFNLAGKDKLLLNFSKDGRPLRTCYGCPEGLIVTDGEGRPLCESNVFVWSGVSWLCLGVSDIGKVKLEFTGKEPIWVKYRTTEAEK